MKIVNRQPVETADVSASRHTAGREFVKLVLAAALFLAGFYVVLGVAVDFIVSRISFETESRLFHAIGTESFAMGESVDSEKVQGVNRVLETLIGTGMAPPLTYTVRLMDRDAPNAFAIPGGTIGITRGLLEKLDDDMEIAFVLGHELGHFKHRDHLRGFGRAAGFGLLMAAVFGGSPGAESLGQVMQTVLQQNYSREQEKAADRFALTIVHAAYGETHGIAHLFGILHAARKIPGWAYMLASHPSPEKRIREMEQYAKNEWGITAMISDSP